MTSWKPKRKLNKEQTTQKNLKQIVGDRLKKREDLSRILTPSRRCWVLDYPPESQLPRFHMDVLPAIPNRERSPTGILITDTELVHWQKSNPKAYADWFYGQMKVVFEARRLELAKSLQAANVEEVPEWQVKTPLQRVIQILKRHRDIHFQNNQDNRPISIIINTLTARVYRNQASVYDALTQIIQDIESNCGKSGFVENRNGRWWIANPVDPDENFADKWNEYPERREAFIRWLQKVRNDFAAVSLRYTLDEAANILTPVLGERTMASVARNLGLKTLSDLPAIKQSAAYVPDLGDIKHRQSPPWPIQNLYKCKVKGSVHHIKRGRKLWELTNRPVPKKIWIRFSTDTNVPRPYEVRWQVVNTGQEALRAGQLRGDFYDSDIPDLGIRWETTAYNGTHWVEAFIIKNGTCVARSGQKTVKVR